MLNPVRWRRRGVSVVTPGPPRFPLLEPPVEGGAGVLLLLLLWDILELLVLLVIGSLVEASRCCDKLHYSLHHNVLYTM